MNHFDFDLTGDHNQQVAKDIREMDFVQVMKLVSKRRRAITIRDTMKDTQRNTPRRRRLVEVRGSVKRGSRKPYNVNQMLGSIADDWIAVERVWTPSLRDIGLI